MENRFRLSVRRTAAAPGEPSGSKTKKEQWRIANVGKSMEKVVSFLPLSSAQLPSNRQTLSRTPGQPLLISAPKYKAGTLRYRKSSLRSPLVHFSEPQSLPASQPCSLRAPRLDQPPRSRFGISTPSGGEKTAIDHMTIGHPTYRAHSSRLPPALASRSPATLVNKWSYQSFTD